ncbi:MAG: GIY-YIG nuclease family protein [Sphingobacteriales bacterium]|nr:GIY-YIG nuclease family protein [Sphingobacteriales bacterium]
MSEKLKLNLISILNIYNEKVKIDMNKVKAVRHMDSRIDFKKLIRNELLEEYQSYQSKNVFHSCDYIASFIADGGTRSLFVGIYKVVQKPMSPDVYTVSDLLIECNHTKTIEVYKYALEKITDFEELERRLVIDWGNSTLSWHQWILNSNKRVIEILPKGFVKSFTDYLDFILSFSELKEIIENKEANREWHNKLSSVGGIYLIVDTLNGNQYIGSAYGENGILGRWTRYVKENMKENKALIELVSNNHGYENNFNFSILRTLPKSITDKEVIQIENLYKAKLGTKVFGLNLN